MKLGAIIRTDFTCTKCNREYVQSIRSGRICYYCHLSYSSCCSGKCGTCAPCWESQPSAEQRAQKQRYWRVVRGNLKPILIIFPIVFFAILGSVLMSTVGTFVGLSILLVGTFGSVGIFSVVYIKKAKAVERKYNASKTKKKRPPLQKFEKMAIGILIGLLGVIILSGIIFTIIFFA